MFEERNEPTQPHDAGVPRAARSDSAPTDPAPTASAPTRAAASDSAPPLRTPDTANPHGVRRGLDGEAWVTLLEDPPGLAMLAELLEVTTSSLGDLELLTTLAAWERVSSWITARHLEALSALEARADRFGGLRQAAALLAAELRCTQRSAENKLALANRVERLPAVADALEAGSLDVAKARVVVEEASSAPASRAEHVAALGVALAPTKTPPQLRRALQAAVLGLDPAAAAERTERAAAGRRVEFQPLPDAMAVISAFLPAVDAMAVKTALDALARTPGKDDPRTFDQRRADALSAIFHAVCDAGEAPLHPEHLVSTGRERGPAESPHHSARSAQPRGGRTAGDAGPSVLWRRLATTARQRPHLQVTVAGTTLLGLDDRPAELAGYGPVPADVARTIATDATWRAILTDPGSGTVTAVGENRYRPGAVLAREVAARDRTCTFAGCSLPAARCDLDHREAFDPRVPAAVQTRKGNLHALCRFHHNLKTLHGWSPSFDEATGVTRWTSPLGSGVDRPPEPALPPWEDWLTAAATPPRLESPCPCAADPPDTGQEGDAARANELTAEPGEPPEEAPAEPDEPPPF